MLKYFTHLLKWIVVVVGLLIFWLTQEDWFTDTYFWQKVDGTLIDYRFEFRAFRTEDLADPRIKLIGLNDTSFQLDSLSPEEIAASPVLQKMQQPWPWDRSVYAAVLDKLMNAGAKVVVFDLVFASANEGDDDFAKALVKYKDHVVIGEMLQDEEVGSNNRTKKLTPPNKSLSIPGTETVPGLVNTWQDGDGVIRRMRFRTSPEREMLESGECAPGIVAYYTKAIRNGTIPDNLIHVTALAAEKYQGKIITPTPDSKTFIDFQGSGETYRAWPVENMFVDALWQKPPFSGGEGVSNKIVIVGPLAEIFHDVHTTPYGEMPGPEIHAQALSALLRGQWLTASSNRANILTALGAVALGIFICVGIPQAMLKAVLLVVSVLLFLVGSQIAFTHYNHVVEMMPPLFCLLGTSSFGIIFEYSMEQFERRRYRNILNRYVSKNVAKVILADRRSLEESMRGMKKPVTILFSDIRSFTTWTEQSDPDKLVSQLNEYFQEMVGIIQDKNQGTLQKFIGDAIMAAWGDTYTAGIDVDARRAVTAALAMRPALAKLNQDWKDKPDRRVLATGIGVNHGDVVNGNVGSKDRMELTVLGDGVNLAARLESATKQFHTDILIGETVEKLTREHFIYRSVGLITVKGKTKPVEVFALINDKSVPPPSWLETYHVAVKMFRQREFKESVERLKFVQEQITGGDYLCEMYLKHCEEFQANPPPDNWDGAFTLGEK